MTNQSTPDAVDPTRVAHELSENVAHTAGEANFRRKSVRYEVDAWLDSSLNSFRVDKVCDELEGYGYEVVSVKTSENDNAWIKAQAE